VKAAKWLSSWHDEAAISAESESVMKKRRTYEAAKASEEKRRAIY